MIHAKQERITTLMNFIVPKLQKADWRKNNYSNFVLEPDKN